MKAERSEQIVVRIDPETLSQLRKVSEQEERTVAQTVRFVIRQYLEAVHIDGPANG